MYEVQYFGIIIGLVSLLSSVSAGEWIRINQLGYLPESPKVAVFMSEGKAAVEEYVLVEVFTGEFVKWFDNPKKANTWGRMQSVYRLIQRFQDEGTYVVGKEGNYVSSVCHRQSGI